MDERNERVEALLRAFIIRQYRTAHEHRRRPVGPGGYDNHLAGCPDLTAVDVDAQGGSYGCDTGCDYARFEAVLTCPHGEREEYMYGTFGELSYMVEDMIEEADRDEELSNSDG
jgi:hypothetical protein